MISNTAIFKLDIFGLEESDLFFENLIRTILVAAGGEIAGRVRLQKLVYLLDKLGLESGFRYSYHHYGPYSAELSSSADLAQAFGFVEEIFKHRASDGARFSLFKSGESHLINSKSDFLDSEVIRNAIAQMNSANSTVLELAATAYWLRHDEGLADWSTEIVRRKGSKVENGRLEKAISLLNDLKLSL